MINSELETMEVLGTVLKVFRPSGTLAPKGVIWLNHGWTGDENSMWVFARPPLLEYMIVAPRAPHVSEHEQYGGYSWVEQRSGKWSPLEAFLPSVALLGSLMDAMQEKYRAIDFSQLRMAGFSQGAALSYAYTLLHPDRVERLAALAGFLPEGDLSITRQSELAGKPVLIAHGENDETVPLSKAETAHHAMLSVGADVQFCTSPVGHKLGANCMTAFTDFITR